MLEYQTTNPQYRDLFERVAALQTTWNLFKSAIESSLSTSLGRKVELLNGNFVSQKAGVVTYHGSIAGPGRIYLPRKGWDAKKGKFWVWVIIR